MYQIMLYTYIVKHN